MQLGYFLPEGFLRCFHPSFFCRKEACIITNWFLGVSTLPTPHASESLAMCVILCLCGRGATWRFTKHESRRPFRLKSVDMNSNSRGYVFSSIALGGKNVSGFESPYATRKEGLLDLRVLNAAKPGAESNRVASSEGFVSGTNSITR